jgi:hypothetical protein
LFRPFGGRPFGVRSFGLRGCGPDISRAFNIAQPRVPGFYTIATVLKMEVTAVESLFKGLVLVVDDEVSIRNTTSMLLKCY